MTQYEAVVQKLDELGLLAGGWGAGPQRIAHCPGPLHGPGGDRNPSLSVGEGRYGRALLYCHTGCDFSDIMTAIGLDSEYEPMPSEADPVAAYIYVNEAGDPLYRNLRFADKRFLQERRVGDGWEAGLGDVRRVLFNLPGVREAATTGATVWFTEGEKDALTLLGAGVVATTSGGRSVWNDEYIDQLKGIGTIILTPDLDSPGLEAADKRRSILEEAGFTVVTKYPAAGKDVTDHFNEGLGFDDFLDDEPIDLSELQPLDWTQYERVDTTWLLEPWVPRNGRVLAFGAAGSLKSLWALWLATKLADHGEHVAYISLEMTLTDLTRRLHQLDPDPEFFHLFTHFQLSNPDHYRLMRRALQGYALIVVDSWTAAGGAVAGRDQNQAVADLDRELFLPLIEDTGATLLVLDNTGHASFTRDGDKIPADHARGASAKGDKMDLTIWFDRPSELNNYRTRITCKKMRLDEPTPTPVTVETPQDRIEFYYVEGGSMTQRPMWGEDYVDMAEQVVDRAVESEMTVAEQLALARLRDRLKATEVPSAANEHDPDEE